MPLLADEIKRLLTQYDKRRGFFYFLLRFLFRFLFRDPPAIKALRKLNSADKNNIFKVYQCFVENLPKDGESAYVVYIEILKHVSKNRWLHDTVSLLNFFIEENLTTQHSSNIVCGDYRYNDLSRILSYLKYSQLLNRENLNDSFCKGFSLLKSLSESPNFGLLSQELLNLIKLSSVTKLALLEIIIRGSHHRPEFINLQNLLRLLQLPENSFLSTADSFGTIWHRIPTHLFTQALFDQLIRLSQQQDPEEQLQQYVNQLIGFRENQVELNREVVVNDQQSTHRASVHQSVSDSASRLFKLYGLKIEGNHLQNTLQLIHHYIMQLPENSLKNTAAKNCLQRIIKFEFTDPGSGVTIPQVLALSFLAVNDKAKRIGDVSDALQQFVEGLYEIQRGYNLSENGHDQGGFDKPICTAGTFNKLIEKLEGIHPDVEVLHITPANASLKLPIVVREVAFDYLESLAKPQTIEALQQFTQLIEQLRQGECVDIIWDQIKPKITDRMFDEFGSLYTGKTDPRLNDLIESGQYLKLENLSRFQEQILASPGSQVLRSPSLNFFSQLKATDSDSGCSSQSRDRSRRFGS